ncbi:MAG TPA: hypothetical protein VMA96_12895 [Solirubrobacteraceae bacterium]|nr:hypothetical protein [Solirubrobacteraceae bacterium]
MTRTVTTTISEMGARLLDDAYLAWFSAESECEQALRAWFHGTDGGRPGAYLAYRIALDREEAAARNLERVWRFAEPRDARFVSVTESVVQ